MKILDPPLITLLEPISNKERKVFKKKKKKKKKEKKLKSRESKEERNNTLGLQTHGRPWSKTHGWVSPAVGLLKCWPRGSSSSESIFGFF
jgi:hypothetical protein